MLLEERANGWLELASVQVASQLDAEPIRAPVGAPDVKASNDLNEANFLAGTAHNP